MLTQAEIDALLSGTLEVDQSTSEGGVNLAELMGEAPPSKKKKGQDKQVRPYNFWSPDRFSKEQMRAVELVHEDLAERLTSTLPPYLRAEFRPRVVHTEQGRFDDFLRDLPEGYLFHLLNLDPLPGRLVLTISPEISWVMLTRLLGGSDEKSKRSDQLTEIGQSLMEVVVSHTLNDMKAAWSRVVDLEPRLEDTTLNLHWVQMAMGNERVMLITFEIAIHDTTGTMNIYIPFSMIKPVANILNPHVWISGKDEKKTDMNARQLVIDAVAGVPLSLRVILGDADISVSDLMNLQEGDVICLNNSISHNLPVLIVDKPRFTGKIGRIGKRLAVQISTVTPSLDTSIKV